MGGIMMIKPAAYLVDSECGLSQVEALIRCYIREDNIVTKRSQIMGVYVVE